jgi:Zn finger protein HypA/HybF involved in hydrogenase expression
MTFKRKYPECLASIGLEVDEDFISSNHKHRLKCLLCGGVFYAQPKSKFIHYERTKRKGCPECTSKERFNGSMPVVVTPLSKMNIERHDFLANIVKMKCLSGYIPLKRKSDYECQICKSVAEYDGSYLLRRYKEYTSVGCTECTLLHKRQEYIRDINKQLEDYHILTKYEDHKNISEAVVTFERKECGHVFSTRMHNMLYGNVTCPVCNDIRMKSQTGIYCSDGTMVKKRSYSHEEVMELFKERLLSQDKPLRFENITSYEAMHIPMTFICGKCDRKWDARPANVLFLNSGCPYCAVGNYSKISIEWLNSIMASEGVYIQHAENGGEKSIVVNGKRYYVDGYCEETNTIYEFHGSYFHGDPVMFDDEDRPHPFNKNITAKELYDNTIERESILRDAGYALISIGTHIPCLRFLLIVDELIRASAATLLRFLRLSSKRRTLSRLHLLPAICNTCSMSELY